MTTTPDTLAKLAAPFLDLHLDEHQAGLLRDMLGDDPDEAAPLRMLIGEGHSGHGLYVAQSEYQDEGAVLLVEIPLANVEAQALPAAEPFGYFKAEPFGWTDCAPTAEGVIALYEHPQQAAQATAGWVSVEDWPAVDGEPVLVCVAGQFAGEARHIDSQHGWWWAGSDPTDMHDGRVYPTHIMAMPEPTALPQPQPQSAQSKGDA